MWHLKELQPYNVENPRNFSQHTCNLGTPNCDIIFLNTFDLFFFTEYRPHTMINTKWNSPINFKQQRMLIFPSQQLWC